jgi:protein BUR2
MLEYLTFDLMVDIPYNRLFRQLEDIELIHNRPIRDGAWAYCNDACLTVLPLLMPARDISISAIFFAATVANQKIGDVRGEAWWRFLDGNETHITKAIAMMTEFYKENPLRKQDAKLPGSPEFNLESTRRTGEAFDDLSLGETPVGTDRGTQSPRSGPPARPNGKLAHSNDAADGSSKAEEGTSSKREEMDPNSSMVSVEIASQMSRGDSDAPLKAAANDLSRHDHGLNNGGLRSPVIPGSKRKSIDMDVDSDHDREAKKARTGDEDEGEVKSIQEDPHAS